MEYLLLAMIVLIFVFAYFEIKEDVRYAWFPEYAMFTAVRLIPHIIGIASLILNMTLIKIYV
jgi:hypothetical protein